MSDRIIINPEDLKPPIVVTEQDVNPRLIITPEALGLSGDVPTEAQATVPSYQEAEQAFGQPVNLRQRMSALGEKLVSNNPEDGTWSQRLKRYAGNNLLAHKDRKFRSTLYQVIGGSVIYYAGGALALTASEPSLKAAGAITAAVGAAKYMDAGLLNTRRFNEVSR